MSLVPFRLPEPLAIVSLDGANWRIDTFAYGECTAADVLIFATIDQAGDHAADLYIEGARVLFKEWTSSVQARMLEALQ